MVDTLLVDHEAIYDPRRPNDRLLLGLKGSMSEYEIDLLPAAEQHHSGGEMRSLRYSTAGVAAIALALLASCGPGDNVPQPVVVGTGTIGTAGAALTTGEATPGATVEIAAGALQGSTELSLEERARPEGAPEILGPAYRLAPEDLRFGAAAPVTVRCDSQTRPLIASATLQLSRLVDGKWEALEDVTWDPDHCIATGKTEEAGIFGLVPVAPIQTARDVEGMTFELGTVTVCRSRSATRPLRALR